MIMHYVSAQPPNFPPVVIELEEIRNMRVKDIKLSAMSSDPFMVILTEGRHLTTTRSRYNTVNFSLKSLNPRGRGNDFKNVISKHRLGNKFMSIAYEIVLM